MTPIPSTHLPRRPRARGFTMIELLVVVTIIGILASIIAGALSGFLGSANEAKNAANMRNWGEAIHVYMSRNAGRVPRLAAAGEPLYAASDSLRAFFEEYKLPPKIAYPPGSKLFAAGAASGTWQTVDMTTFGDPDYGSATIIDDAQTIPAPPLPSPATLTFDEEQKDAMAGSLWEERTPGDAYNGDMYARPDGGSYTGENWLRWKYSYPYAEDITYTVEIQVYAIVGPTRSSQVLYTCTRADGSPIETRLSQYAADFQGKWMYLKDPGTGQRLQIKVRAGDSYTVTVSDQGAGSGLIIADALRVVAVAAESDTPSSEPGFRTLGGTWVIKNASWSYPQGAGSFHQLDLTQGNAKAEWIFPNLSSGLYEVSLWLSVYSTWNTAVPFTIHHANGTKTVVLNQTTDGVPGGGWFPIADVQFESGKQPKIVMGNATGSGQKVSIDAARIARRPVIQASKSAMGYLWIGNRPDPCGTTLPGTSYGPHSLSSSGSPSTEPVLVDWITPEAPDLWTQQGRGGHVLFLDGHVTFKHTEQTSPRWIDDGEGGTYATFYW